MRTVRQYVRRSGHFWLCTHGPAESAFTVAIVGALPSLPFRFVSSVGSFAPRTDGVRVSGWMHYYWAVKYAGRSDLVSGLACMRTHEDIPQYN